MSEISQAFDHPEARSKATANRPLDRISLRNHVETVEIGAFQAERGVTQRISFNVAVEVRPSTGAQSDDVDDILSYDRVTWAIQTELQAERLNLLETLAERIALRILAEPQAVRVFLRIEKLDKGSGALGVEIMRSEDDLPRAEVQTKQALDAVVVHLTPEYLAQADLGELVSQIRQTSSSFVISVSADGADFAAMDNVPVRRQDLLSIEQVAWRLAAEKTEFVPVDTWTEMDWGLKNDQISIWAPSKMVFDCPDPEVGNITTAQKLSEWLASELGARHLVLSDESDTLALGEEA